MRTKKILAMLSAIAMLGCLASCGGSSSSTADTSSSKKEESSAADTTTTAATAEAATTTTSATTTEEPLPTPDEGAITFDTASLYTAHAGDDSGAAQCNLDIVNLDGNNKLRVQVLDKNDKGEYNIPKIIFDLPTLLGAENVCKIGKISADMTCKALETWKNDDGSESLVVGNFIGTFGSTLAMEKGTDADGNLIQNTWSQTDFTFQDWENPTHNWHFEATYPIKNLPANNYSENGEGTNLLIMRWGQLNQVDFYIDNLTFYDKDGKVMPLVFDAAAATVEVKNDTLKITEGGNSDAPANDTTAAAATEASQADTTAAAAQ